MSAKTEPDAALAVTPLNWPITKDNLENSGSTLNKHLKTDSSLLSKIKRLPVSMVRTVPFPVYNALGLCLIWMGIFSTPIVAGWFIDNTAYGGFDALAAESVHAAVYLQGVLIGILGLVFGLSTAVVCGNFLREKWWPVAGYRRITLELAGSGDSAAVEATYRSAGLSADRLRRILKVPYDDRIQLRPRHEESLDEDGLRRWAGWISGAVGDGTCAERIAEWKQRGGAEIMTMEAQLDVDRPDDEQQQGDTPVETLADDNDIGHVTDQVTGTISMSDFDVEYQVVVADYCDGLDRNESKQDVLDAGRDGNPYWNAVKWLLNLVQGTNGAGDRSRKAGSQEKLDDLQLANIRVAVLVGEDQDSEQAKYFLEDVASSVSTPFPGHVNVKEDINFTGNGRRERGRVGRVLGDMEEQVIRTAGPGLRRFIASKITPYFVLDNLEVWSILLVPGKGSERAMSALRVGEREQYPTNSLTEDERDQFSTVFSEPADVDSAEGATDVDSAEGDDG